MTETEFLTQMDMLSEMELELAAHGYHESSKKIREEMADLEAEYVSNLMGGYSED